MSAAAELDAASLRVHVGAVVDVLSDDGRRRKGRLYAVDPVSSSLVLLQGQVTFTAPDSMSADAVEVVLGRALKSVDVLTPLSELSASPEELAAWAPANRLRLLGFAAPALCPQLALSDEEGARRREGLIRHLEKHFVPVDPSGGSELRVLGCLSVHPPYTPEACRSQNVLVLERVRRLVREVADGDWGRAAAAAAAVE